MKKEPHNFLIHDQIQERSNQIFNYSYQFKGRMENNSDSGLFQCRIHQTIKSQTIGDHLSGKHCCEECAALMYQKSRNKTDDEIQRRSDLQFGFYKFLGRHLAYSKKGYFKCTKHDRLYLQTIINHEKGFNPCNKCNPNVQNTRVLPSDTFLITRNNIQARSNEKFGNYIINCRLYGSTRNDLRISLFCKKHNTYGSQKLAEHLLKRNVCKDCVHETKQIPNRMTDEEVQLKSDKQFGYFVFKGRINGKVGKGNFYCKKCRTTEPHDISAHTNQGVNGCSGCNGRNNTLEVLQKKFFEKFGDRIKVKKVLGYSFVEAECEIHPEEEIRQSFDYLLKTENGGCKKCKPKGRNRFSIAKYQKRIEDNPKTRGKFIVEDLIFNGTGKSTKAKVKCTKHPQALIEPISASLLGKTVHRCPKCKPDRSHTQLKDKEIKQKITQNIKEHYPNYRAVNYTRVNGRWRVNLICMEHKTAVSVLLDNMKYGNTSCSRCIRIKRQGANLKTYEDFKQQGKIKYNDKYNYPEKPFESYPFETHKSKLLVFCPVDKHGYFETSYSKHITNKAGGECPKCSGSNGEKEIHRILKKQSIQFEIQKTFPDCIGDRNLLRFDVYIEKLNLAIEFDGEGHSRPVRKFHQSEQDFEKSKRYDQIKNKYAFQHKLNLLRIAHFELNKASSLIDEAFRAIDNRKHYFRIT